MEEEIQLPSEWERTPEGCTPQAIQEGTGRLALQFTVWLDDKVEDYNPTSDSDSEAVQEQSDEIYTLLFDAGYNVDATVEEYWLPEE